MMIPYLGEKSKYSDFIIPNIPKNISTYVEPFGGMFGIYFCLDLRKYLNTKFVYNDINYLNYNLFKHLVEPSFIFHLENIKVNKEYYDSAKKKIYDCSDPDKAILWLILLTCSSSQVDILNGVWKGDSEFEILKLKIKGNPEYFYGNLSVNNKDYKEIMSKYDSKDSFFFIDPPYYGKESYYINHDFINDKSHIDLFEFLKTIKGKFMLSYLYFPKLDEWYSKYRIDIIQTFIGKECLIMNY